MWSHFQAENQVQALVFKKYWGENVSLILTLGLGCLLLSWSTRFPLLFCAFHSPGWFGCGYSEGWPPQASTGREMALEAAARAVDMGPGVLSADPHPCLTLHLSLLLQGCPLLDRLLYSFAHCQFIQHKSNENQSDKLRISGDLDLCIPTAHRSEHSSSGP